MVPRNYKRLRIDFEIPEELDHAIDVFLDYINNHENTLCEDCYRDELDFWIKDLYNKIPQEDYDALRYYYVQGGIYLEDGKPREYDAKHDNKK